MSGIDDLFKAFADLVDPVREQLPVQPHVVTPYASVAPSATAQTNLAAAQARRAAAERSLAASRASLMSMLTTPPVQNNETMIGQKENTMALDDDIINEVARVTYEVPRAPQPQAAADGSVVMGGLDILGAVSKAVRSASVVRKIPPRAGFIFKKAPGTPKGKGIYTSLVVHKQKDPMQSVRNARDAGKRAVARGNQLLAALKKGKVKGKNAFAVSAKLKKLAQAAVAAGKAAIKDADKHEVFTLKRRAKLKSPKQMIRGDGGYYDDEIVGALIGALTDPDPNNPGYLMDGTPDPRYGAPAGDPSANNFGVGPMPTMASVQQQILAQAIPDPGVENDMTFYDSTTGAIPDGAVPCDWSHGTPDEAVGSLTRFYQTSLGHFREGFDLRTTSWKGGAVTHDPGWMVYRNGGQQMDTVEDNEANTSRGNYVPQIARASGRAGYGPLVGNKYPETANLRYDVGGDQWFWYRDKAPAWATAVQDMAALNQAVVDWRAQVAAAAADAAAQAAQSKLDQQQADAMAQQQGLQDAQMAHDQQVQQQQMDMQQAQYEQQMAQQQGQMDAQYQQMLMDQQKQQAQLDFQAQQYAIQHPEQFMPPADDGGGGYADQGYDDGGGDGYVDDGGGDTSAWADRSSDDTIPAPPSGDEGDTVDWGE